MTGDLGTRLEAMQSLLENTLAHRDPADAAGLAVLRQRFDTTRREFEARSLEAEEARRRMRAYHDQSAFPTAEDAVEGHQDYAHDAVLVAMIALEEAELATLEAILNKIEANQSTSSE